MQFTILGEPCSKANSRTMIFRKGHKPRCIKSKKALEYTDSFMLQAKKILWRLMPLKGDVILTCHIYYSSLRPDLDESLIMDCLQKAEILKNDRQIKEKHIFHHLDKKNPRAEISVMNK